MRTAASVFSWLGGIATTIFGFVYLSKGQTVTYTTYNYYYGYSQSTQTVPYPPWLWVLWVIFVIVRLIILIWRQAAVENGNKVGCGVCTLLFASVIGGILTLCIPESQLGGYSDSSSRSSYSSSSRSSSTARTPLDRAAKISEYEQQLRSGTITREEYNRKVALLDGKPYSSVAKPVQKTMSEDEKIEIISKYKKLLDDGVITKEEFENKKQEIL